MSENIYLREIRESDNTSKLSLGAKEFTPLKSFLKKSAFSFHINNIGKTYVLVENQFDKPCVRGYVTLMCSEIKLELKQRPNENPNAKNYKFFPAVKITKLAIDKNLQGNGFGLALMDYCITIANQLIMPHIGCRFLTVDSKKEAITFYEKSGFIIIDTEKNKKSENPAMFLDLNKLVEQKNRSNSSLKVFRKTEPLST